MSTNTMKDLVCDLILEHAEVQMDRGCVFISNAEAIAEIILNKIQETHFILERGPTIDHSDHDVDGWPEPKVSKSVDPAAMDRIGEKIAATKASASWAGDVDRQGGSFSDQEIANSYKWR